jgi:succinate dehydrogenase / fumarate reductase membrane anchor subunit
MVLGLGSAEHGTGHWWAQRITAAALIPLGLWFAISVLGLPVADYGAVRSWLAQPLNSSLMVLLAVSVLHHSQLGIQVVVEDYVHDDSLKAVTLSFSRFLHIVLAVAAIYALLSISFGFAT